MKSKSSPLEDLIMHSFKIGMDNSLVQGAGGNTSFKDENYLWVKASGNKLREAKEKNIFLKLDLEKARKLSFFDDARLISSAVIEPMEENLRPSIETAMHSIIKAPVVTHIHSLGSIGSSILKNPSEAIDKISKVATMAWIPYLRPGAELAKAIFEVVNESHNALLLGNHGMTVWGDSFYEVESRISNIEMIWRSSQGLHSHLKSSTKVSKIWAEILCGGILTPDEAIFLGEQPFKRVRERASTSAIVQICKNGSLIFDKNLSSDSIDIAQVLINLDGLVDNFKAINFLSDKEIQSIVNWDMEKYRQEINK